MSCIGFPGFLLLGAWASGVHGAAGSVHGAVLRRVNGVWIWMLVDCATKEADTGNNKVVWILVIASRMSSER